MKYFNLSNLTIMITGVSGQLGRTLTTALLNSGANILGVDKSLSLMNEASSIEGWNSKNILFVEVDVRKRSQVKKAISLGVSRFGRLDGLINNAAVSVFEPWYDRTDENFDLVTDVNLKGTFFCMCEYFKYLIDTGVKGAVVNIASHYGIISPDPRIYKKGDRRNSEIYGATKAGLIQMTKYFAVNAINDGAKVRVNAIAPGGIRNPFKPQSEEFQKLYSNRCPLGRMAELEEMIEPTLFLLSTGASYVNGHTLVVDGGMTSW